MSNILFIADTHFYHNNILKYENRPFSSIEEMNERLIDNWNSRVKTNDKIFMLGDFMFAHKNKLPELVSRLNGYKILVMGNHDQLSPLTYINAGFSEVYRYPVIFENFYILSHAPIYINSNMPYANIFGHIHSNPSYKDYTRQSICVSVERKHMNYYPISFNEIKELMESSTD